MKLPEEIFTSGLMAVGAKHVNENPVLCRNTAHVGISHIFLDPVNVGAIYGVGRCFECQQVYYKKL